MTRVLAYVEIDVPFCQNTYGAAPCTASIPTTGAIKCFNTLASCQDRVNFIDDPVTLRFSQDHGFLPPEIDCIPSMTGIAFTPGTVSLGKDLGTRASLSVTFKDHPWPDTGPGGDPYLADRTYDPFRQGTFWGKFRARQPFLRGRALRLIRGEPGQALGEMETRHYVIDSFTHDASDGSYTLVAKDVLKLTDDDRAQAPVLSRGFLSGAIDAVETTATLQPTGIGNEDYAGAGYLAIGGKEICAFTRDATAGNDSDTKLLLHMAGADASTSFTDSSSGAKTVTRNGNTQVDTAVFKFGGSSALFDGTGDYLSLADHADWTPAGDFCIEVQAQWNALASTQYLFTHFTDANNRYFLSVSSAGALTFSVISASSTIVTMTSAAGAVAADAVIRHIAVIRTGNVWNVTVDGVSVATVTDSDAIPNFTGAFRIGVDHAAANGFNGWMDEFRVSHVARFTLPFTPPVSPYEQSSNLLVLTRGQLGTTAIAHEANDRVQQVLHYAAEDAADIIRDLLVTYAGVDDAYIPIAAWQTETASFLNRVFTATITEPTGVNKLISELIEDAALSLWWDDITPQLRLRVLRAISTDAALFDQGNYLEGSFSSDEQPNARLSQIWRYFAKRNPLEGQDDADNYRSVAATVDLGAETDYGSAAIHKIYSRWIPFGGRSVADRANDLYLSRFRDPPRRFTFATFRDGITVPQLGLGYRIAGLGLQDETGASVSAPIQITRLNPGEARFEIEAEEMLVAAIAEENLTDRIVIIDTDTLNVDLRALHDTLYPAPTDPDVIAGVNLTCYVETGVIVGSSSLAAAAFIVGSWPTGFPITLIVTGRIQGAGGNGGTNGGGNGVAGGVALYTRHDIDLEVAAGDIFGGGGGGGGSQLNGGGTATGGGGAGQLPGPGGTKIGGGSVHLGNPGTTEAGGTHTSSGTVLETAANGGGPGLAGGHAPLGGGTGGAAGSAIDGDSFVTVTVGPGDIRGPQIN